MPQILSGLAPLPQKQLIRKYYFLYQLLRSATLFEVQVPLWMHSLFLCRTMRARAAAVPTDVALVRTRLPA
jgi:hypothetical protein